MHSGLISSVADCCFLLYSLQHNKTAVQVKEDMKKMVQIPMLRPMTFTAKYTKLFGVSLFELQEKGLMEDGVPLVLRRMVDHLRKHGKGKKQRKKDSKISTVMLDHQNKAFMVYLDELAH